MSAITQPDPCAACGADPGGSGKKKSHPCKYVPIGAAIGARATGVPMLATEPLLIFSCANCGYSWPKQTNLTAPKVAPL